MISRHANIIKRHRNPVGIFSRVLIYLPIGVGAWRHQLDLAAAGAALKAMLWTAEPPAGETFGFVEDAIGKELGWFNAPSGPQKTLSLSFVLLALYPVAVFTGLWRRSWRLLAASAALLAIFYLLMLSVAAKS